MFFSQMTSTTIANLKTIKHLNNSTINNYRLSSADEAQREGGWLLAVGCFLRRYSLPASQEVGVFCFLFSSDWVGCR